MQILNINIPCHSFLPGSFCDMVWDNIMCWDATPAGTTAKMKCPHYIEGFSNTGIHVVCYQYEYTIQNVYVNTHRSIKSSKCIDICLLE